MELVRISADIEYLDGTLAGMVIPDGWSATYPKQSMFRITRWLERVRRQDDFIRATGTGNRYKVRGNIRVQDLRQIVYS